MPLADIIPEGRPVKEHRPWPRTIVTPAMWSAVAGHIAAGRASLFGLWAEAGAVHMAILEDATGALAVVTLECPDGRFPSVAALHPPAMRLERAIQSLFGFVAEGLPDPRPWLDLGFWGVTHPLSRGVIPGRREAADPESILRGGDMDSGLASSTRPGMTTENKAAAPYAFLPSTGEGLHQIAVGPVHAGIIEPGHFRFTANGEHLVRLEQRLGYVHKGIESLMAGASLDKAARLAGRTSGDSTVAYAFAFAQAVEAALEVHVPERAVHLRALMAELERIANHFGDIGAICNDASFSLLHAQFGILREQTLRAADRCFGHRLMMDCIVPGGVAKDIAADGIPAIRTLLDNVRTIWPQLVELYDNTASLQDRTVTTGIVTPALVKQYGAGGYVGRASGRAFDARRMPGYAPYDRLRFEVPILDAGDVNARVWIRIREVEQSLSLIEQIVDRLPDSAVQAAIRPRGVCEGLGLAEAFRGDVLIWLRLDGERVARCHMRDASWFQWPLLEAAVEGNIVADFPLCNKSFNCSYSGHDL